MMWATSITLAIMGVIKVVPVGQREYRGVEFLIGIWCLGCAYAIWDRIP
ncbi:hypothetical protein [Roseomonas chloroacetimidivorans]